MRKILIVLLIVIVMMSILWIVAGRRISERLNRVVSSKVAGVAVTSIQYAGNGDGGTFKINGVELFLYPLRPHVGSTKENELALAYEGRVFAFGPLRSNNDELLAADVPAGDSAELTTRRDLIVWPRKRYAELYWSKATGQRLLMLWSLDPPDGTPSRLIRVEISDAPR